MKSTKEITIGALTGFLGLAVFFYARQFPELQEGHPGPGLFPRIIGGLLFFAGGILVLQGFRRSEKFESLQGKWLPIILLLCLIILFPFLRDAIGFFVAIPIVIFCVGLLMQLNIIKSILTALGTTGFIYLIFNQILHVPL